MKCLLLMDGYSLWKQLKLFVLFILAYAVGSLVSGQYLFLGFSVMFLLMLPYYLQQMNEGGRVDATFLLASISRKTVVRARYITVLLCTALGLVLAAVTWLVLSPDAGLMLLMQLAICLVSISLVLPLLYRLGAVKGRLTMLLVFAIFFGGTGVLTGLTESGPDLSALAGWGRWILRLALPVALGVLGLSYLISARIYEKREF
ncbi:MAG TPA: ABC-2 transporter permease [Candidatus Onthomonas avicola]|nr:ABC-2 transporter permease [Candidatus Onthomonas avicola]